MNLIAEKLKIKMVSVKEKNRKIIGNFKTLITFNSDDEKTFNMINNFIDKKIYYIYTDAYRG